MNETSSHINEEMILNIQVTVEDHLSLFPESLGFCLDMISAHSLKCLVMMIVLQTIELNVLIYLLGLAATFAETLLLTFSIRINLNLPHRDRSPTLPVTVNLRSRDFIMFLEGLVPILNCIRRSL